MLLKYCLTAQIRMWYFKMFLVFIFLKRYETATNLMQTYDKNEFVVENTTDVPSLISHIFVNYLSNCTPYVLYDDFFFETIVYRDALFQTLVKFRSTPIIHGFIDKFFLESLRTGKGRIRCVHFIVFANDLETILSRLDFQLTSRVVFVTSLSAWNLKEFFISDASRNIQNLLLVSDPTLQKDDYLVKSKSKDINLYTHRLHTDGIGSSTKKILTSWRQNRLTRPNVNLFPAKLDEGFNGHRLVVSASEQPPFVIRKNLDTIQAASTDTWDGIEVQLLKIIARSLNITLSIHETVTSNKNFAAEEIIEKVHKGFSDVGISGIYVTRQFYDHIYFSLSHSQDCASFITLSSTALPKYRAILGPFQWKVWLCVIFIYLFAVIPVAFSHKLTCRMFEGFAEIGSMFWTVFGTFTNLFAFRGEKSWNNYKNSSTRTVIAITRYIINLLPRLGTYWIFTIIITAAYSSSIISFITIPTYFDVVDSVENLLDEDYRVGTLDSNDWKYGFNDTMDNKTNALLKNVDVVNSSILGLEKVQKQKKYAFLGSRNYLSYAIRSNFSFNSGKKKSMYHITSQCLAPFMVSFVMKPKADFLIKFDQQIQRFHENGFIEKIKNDLDWIISKKSGGRLFLGASGRLNAEAPEDRQLTLDDMQGMFLLLGIGINFAVASLLRECWIGYQCCRKSTILRSHRTSIPSIVLSAPSTGSDENISFANKIMTYCERAVSARILASKNKILAAERRFSH